MLPPLCLFFQPFLQNQYKITDIFSNRNNRDDYFALFRKFLQDPSFILIIQVLLFIHNFYNKFMQTGQILKAPETPETPETPKFPIPSFNYFARPKQNIQNKQDKQNKLIQNQTTQTTKTNQMAQTIQTPLNSTISIKRSQDFNQSRNMFAGTSADTDNMFFKAIKTANQIKGDQIKKQEQIPQQKNVSPTFFSFVNPQRRSETLNYDQLIIENTQKKAQIHKLTAELETIRLRQLKQKVQIQKLQYQNTTIKKQRYENLGLSKILSTQNKVAFEDLNKKIDTYCKFYLELKQLFTQDDYHAIEVQIQVNISKNFQFLNQDIVRNIVNLIERIDVIEKKQISEIDKLETKKQGLYTILEAPIKLQGKFDSKLEKKKRLIETTLQPIEAQIKQLEEHIIAIKQYKKKFIHSLIDLVDLKSEVSVAEDLFKK